MREYLEIADGLANSCGGVLRGQGGQAFGVRWEAHQSALSGRQHLGAMFNLVAYYILALPIGITLAFKTDLGLQGLWIGAYPVPLAKLLLILIQVRSSASSQ